MRKKWITLKKDITQRRSAKLRLTGIKKSFFQKGLMVSHCLPLGPHFYNYGRRLESPLRIFSWPLRESNTITGSLGLPLRLTATRVNLQLTSDMHLSFQGGNDIKETHLAYSCRRRYRPTDLGDVFLCSIRQKKSPGQRVQRCLHHILVHLEYIYPQCPREK